MSNLYDLPIRDHFIDKHFNKGRTQKLDKLVIHHNAGHGVDIFQVWQTREASAHYQVHQSGEVEHIVRDEDTAWHAQSANPSSIGIEHENASVGGDWPIADSTLHTGAKLVGYLCAKHGLGEPKFLKNIFYHQYYHATACPGPFFLRVLKDSGHWYWKEAVAYYHEALGSKPSAPAPKPSTPDVSPKKKTTAEIVNEVIAGKWGNGDDRKKRLTASGYNFSEVQDAVNKKLGATSAPKHAATPAPAPKPKPSTPKKAIASVVDEVIAGKWGNGDERKKKLKAAGYNVASIQALVNKRLGASPNTPSAKTVSQMATEVIAGKWGNGDDRKKRLTAAGYDYSAIQAEINRRL